MAVVAEVVVAVVTLLLGLTACTTSSAVAAAASAGRSARRWREDDCGVRREVTYDHRALVLNGTRRMLFSGEMHYPRSTPEIEATQVDACETCLYNHGSADAGHPPSCRSSILGCGCLAVRQSPPPMLQPASS